MPNIRLGLVGGGRWSRILAKSLSMLERVEVCWFTQSNFDHNRRWINQNAFRNNVTVIRARDDLWFSQLNAIIVASPSSTHETYLNDAVANNTDCLVEKPIGYSLKNLTNLQKKAQDRELVIGSNLLMLYETRLIEFKQLICQLPKKVTINWLDPPSEIRFGELKLADRKTPILFDQLSHCWSILKVLGLMNANQDVETIHYNSKNDITLGYVMENTNVEINVSRWSDTRVRTIEIDSGLLRLDFSTGPFLIFKKDQLLKNFGNRHVALIGCLREFLSAVESRKMTFPSDLSVSIESISFILKAQKLLDNMFNRIMLNSDDNELVFFKNLLIDARPNLQAELIMRANTFGDIGRIFLLNKCN